MPNIPDHIMEIGETKNAVRSWVLLRASAVLNIPLCAWFVWFAFSSVGKDHAAFTAFLGHPLNAGLMCLFIVPVFAHAFWGCREIVEDYIQCTWFKRLKLAGMLVFFTSSALLSIGCVLKVALSS